MKKEILDEIEKFASLAFAPEQVAVIVEIDEKKFLNEMLDNESEIFKAYNKGILLTEAKLREVVFDQAFSGSTPAQNIAKTYMDELKLKLMR